MRLSGEHERNQVVLIAKFLNEQPLSSSSDISGGKRRVHPFSSYLCIESYRHLLHCFPKAKEEHGGIVISLSKPSIASCPPSEKNCVLIVVYPTGELSQEAAGLRGSPPSEGKQSRHFLHMPSFLGSLLGIQHQQQVIGKQVEREHVQLNYAVIEPLFDSLSSFPLLSSSSSSSFQIDDSFKQQILFEAQVIRRNSLLKISNPKEEGKNSPSSLSFLVLNTYPFHQGLISPSTTIILSLPNSSSSSFLSSSFSLNQEENVQDISDYSDEGAPLIMASSLLPQFEFIQVDDESSHFPPSLSPSFSSSVPSSIPLSPSSLPKGNKEGAMQQSILSTSRLASKESASATLQVKALSSSLCRVIRREEKQRRAFDLEDETDGNVIVGVTLSTLQHLHLFDESWVFLSTLSSPSKSHVARIYALDCGEESAETNNLNHQTAYLSSFLLFNLSLLSHSHSHSQIVIQSLPSPLSSSYLSAVSKSTLEATETKLPVASQVFLSRIRSPGTDGHSSYSSLLQKHFSIPRVLSQGDIFGVPLFLSPSKAENLQLSGRGGEEEEEEEEEDKGMEEDDQVFENSSMDFAYFQVSKIECESQQSFPSVLVNKSKTSLFQEGAVQSGVPFVSPEDLQSLAGLSSYFPSFFSLLKVAFHPLAGKMNINPTILLHSPASGSGKGTLVRNGAKVMGVHTYEINCYELLGQIESMTQEHLEEIFEKAKQFGPCILHLRNLDCLEKTAAQIGMKEPRSAISNTLKDLLHQLAKSNRELGVQGQVLVVASTTKEDSLSGPLRGCFTHDFKIETPNDKEREEYISMLIQSSSIGMDVSIKELATLTAGLQRWDLRAMVDEAGANAVSRVKDWLSRSPSSFPNTNSQEDQIEREEEEEVEEEEEIELDTCPTKEQVGDVLSVGFSLCFSDFEKAIDRLKRQSSASAGAPKIPKTSWNDVGGLYEAKREILDTVQLPLEHPEMFAEGVKSRSGILLYGPPGTGKTLLAKAVATECNLNFMSVKGPEMINMYVGESEKNIRDLFARARAARPCVIFFDELDSLAPNRGNGADSGGVMDRVVSQLLAELSGLQKCNDLFVIGATNRPDLLDPALLTPGRFDRLVYLGVSENHKSQLNVISALTRKFNLGKSVDLESLSQLCPMNLTGADFYALCSDALLTAMSDQIELLEREEKEGRKMNQDQVQILVEQIHFIRALEKLTPSVSMEELIRYTKLRDTYSMKPKIKQ